MSTGYRFVTTLSTGLAESALAGAGPLRSTPSIFSPASTPADSIYHLSLFVLTICGAIFLVGLRPAVVFGAIPGGGNMPAYGKNLNPAEVIALVSFLKTLHP